MLVLTAVIGLTSYSTTASASELPGQNTATCDLNTNPIVESGSELIGVYDGFWDKDKLSMSVIIYDVQDKKVFTYYSHGKYKPWGINEPDCFRVNGKISSWTGKIVLDTFTNGAKVKYKLTGDILEGTYDLNGGTTKGSFTRVN